MSNTSTNKTANKPTKSNKDKDKLRVIVGEIGRDTKTGILGRGYSNDNGKTFHVTDTMYGRLYDPNDIDGIWNGGTADRVKKEVDSATAEIPAAVSAANSAVQYAESAVAASKVNSDAIVAQSEAISEAKAAMDSATAEIQQTAANAASDAAKIRADVARVQNEVDTAKTANSASVEALKGDIGSAKKDLANVHDSLTKAQSAVEQNQKLINDSVAKITSDVSATKQDLATVHDSLTKAQAAAEQNQKAINDSIAEINANVDATNQDLAGVRKDLTKAQSDITANQKAIDDNVAQISDDITQDRKDIADVRQGLTKAQSDITANQKAIDDNVAQISDDITQDRKDIADVRQGLTKAQSDITANQKAVNDNVAQINSNIEQDRKDIASAQQANADTAKQLDTYSKQATEQGKTIKTIQDKQDGFTATLADVQGNVSQVSDKVDGLSANLKDAQDNVASVKAQADQLSATLTDHAKSIATLTASAKELSSTLEDADGRLSKVEQTAQTNSSTLSDVQGDLSQVKQDATTLTATLKDAQGNISTLQQKADSVSAQLASAQGDIATLQTGVAGVKAILTSHDKSIHTLQLDSKSLKDSMTNAQGDISTLQKSATSLDSEMKDHAGRLSKVEQSAATQATTLSDLQGNLSQVKQQADGLVTTLKDAQGDITQIQQKADGTLAQLKSAQGDIASLQTDVTGIKATLISHEGDIHTLQADSKTLKDDMTDAQGNISSLKKSAAGLTSEMSSQDGRLSKVEQTAKEHTTTISDLGDKLNNMQIGGRNLLTNTDKDISVTSHTTDDWPAWANIDTGFSFEHGKTYTFSAEAKNSTDKIAEASIRVYEHSTDTQVGIYAFPADNNRHSVTFAIPNDSHDYHLLLYAGHAGIIPGVDVTTTYHHPKLEEGNVATDWTPAPEDLATVTQVKQTADGIKTTLKSAQGDIDQIEQKANGTSEQLADVKGDVTNIQKDVNGLKQTTADNAGNIHTLQADSKSLHDDMEDAKGNISSLQKTATSLDSEFKDHDGRISKVEQTAKEYSSTFSDLQGNLSQVKQTADGLVTTLKSAQGDIDQIEQKANGTSEQLADVKGNVTNIQKDVTGLKQTTADNAGNIHTLQADSKTLKDDMTDAQGNISSLQKSSTKLDSEMSSQDGRLSKVEQTAQEHTTTISDLGKKVDSNGGGVNLLTNTQLFDHNWSWDQIGHSFASGVLTLDGNADATSRMFQQLTDNDITGKTFSVSFNARICADCDSTSIEVDAGPYDATKRINITSKDFQRYKVENWQWNSSSIFFSFYVKNGRIDLTNLKLEYGAVATPYSLAPADLATISQVKQTADGIETTLKSAQGDIDQIKQTAKGTSEQLADVQGNVTNIQKDVNGLKQTTADNAGNIHTLQSDSKSLHDSMQDAQGDISTLKKTSTDVTSELKDHAGRISKAEQTASTLVNEFADQQGHLNRVEQTAQGTQQTVANQQGQINNIKTDAAGIHETLTGQGNQIANINVTLNGLNSKYEGVSGDLNKLKDSNQWKTVNGAFDANQYTQTARIFYQDTQAKNTPDPGWFYLLVEAPRNDRVTQTLIKDTYDNSWSRFYTGKWSVWTKGATQLDIDSLSDQINTNSTQITQNKKEIDLKADQSTVDNLSGEVSKNTAQLKVQAGQISSKVASTDFKTLNDKVNGIQVGGRNLITGTSSNWAKVTNDWGPNWSLNPDEWKAGDTITISTEIRNGSQNIFIGFYNTVNGQTITVPSKLSIPAGEEGRLTFAYKLPEGTTEVRPTIYPASGKGTFEYRKLKAEKGNVATDWTPAPEDLTTAIQKNSTAIDQTNQKISLKADQTEVDKIKNTASQNSSRLDVMAGEIKSKVTSTDVNNIVNGKGYATTSTVQSLITQKAGTINESITNLSSKLNGLQVGGVNLVPNTNKDIVVESKTTDTYPEWDNKWIYGPLTNGQTYTISAEATNTNGVQQASVRIFLEYDGSKYVNKEAHEWFFDADGKRHSDTFTVPNDGVGYAVWLFAGPMGHKQGKNFKTTYHHVKLEKGNVATDWSPAPSDDATVTQVQSLTASIDGLQSTVANKADKSQITQLSNVIQSKVSSSDFNDLKDKTLWKSTDSIDLNTAVSQQKIFVKGGSNLPPGGYWWYVQVEPGYDSRIVQYAVSDRDNIHYSRQYDGKQWTSWSQGATESEITQLRDDINLRVKSGDLLSQINIQAGRTLIQSQKIYMDADSVIMGPNTRAFIPSAAIINLDVAKLNAGTINTDRIHIGDDSVYLSVKNNYLRLDGSNTKDKYQLRLTGNDIEFADNDSSNWEYRIQHGIAKYQTDEDGLDFDVYSKRGGANHTVMAVSDAGVMISPSLFFQTDGIDSSNWMGFTRNTVDGNSSVSFHTWNDENEGFHVDCGARFLNYVYINGYARAQGWLTNSTLSKKTNIRKLDLQTALDKIRQDDQYLYEYKRNVAKGIYDPQASFIIDDVNGVAQYSVPREFIDQTGNYREPNVELAYLVAAFQALDKQVQEQQELIKKLEAKLNE